MSDLEDARAIRERMTADLLACTCCYPLQAYSNISGHDRACPTSARFMERHHLTKKDTAR